MAFLRSAAAECLSTERRMCEANLTLDDQDYLEIVVLIMEIIFLQILFRITRNRGEGAEIWKEISAAIVSHTSAHIQRVIGGIVGY